MSTGWITPNLSLLKKYRAKKKRQCLKSCAGFYQKKIRFNTNMKEIKQGKLLLDLSETKPNNIETI